MCYSCSLETSPWTCSLLWIWPKKNKNWKICIYFTMSPELTLVRIEGQDCQQCVPKSYPLNLFYGGLIAWPDFQTWRTSCNSCWCCWVFSAFKNKATYSNSTVKNEALGFHYWNSWLYRLPQEQNLPILLFLPYPPQKIIYHFISFTAAQSMNITFRSVVCLISCPYTYCFLALSLLNNLE